MLRPPDCHICFVINGYSLRLSVRLVLDAPGMKQKLPIMQTAITKANL